ncbi:MAG: hypothetical protein AAB289_06115 [Chloroflexota bacterium]
MEEIMVPGEATSSRRGFLRLAGAGAAAMAAACAPAAAPSAPAPATGGAAAPAAKPAWEQQWEDLVAAAKKEGKPQQASPYQVQHRLHGRVPLP